MCRIIKKSYCIICISILLLFTFCQRNSTGPETVDVGEILYPPSLYYPEENTSIRETLPTFHWEFIENGIGYHLQVDTDSLFLTPEIDTVGITFNYYTPSDSLANDTFFWRVRVKGEGGDWTDWSSPFLFEILDYPDLELIHLYDDMAFVAGGEFIMGRDIAEGYDWDCSPAHRVYLDGYYIDKYEVTNEQYAAYLKEALAMGTVTVTPEKVIKNGYILIHLIRTSCQIKFIDNEFVVDEGKRTHPVVEVTWYGAEAYAHHYGRRLPTEAEWEKAARGTDERFWPWGNNHVVATSYANCEMVVGHTTPVGQYSPFGDSPYQCCDMAGNVAEWCNDWYNEDYYQRGLIHNPQGPSSGTLRVIRGGDFVLPPNGARCYIRFNSNPATSNSFTGFRCVRDIN